MCVYVLRVHYLVTVFMVLEASIIVHETVQLLKTFVLFLCLLENNLFKICPTACVQTLSTV